MDKISYELDYIKVEHVMILVLYVNLLSVYRSTIVRQ